MGDVIWPPVLTKADEKKRAAAGLTIKKDGWHKSIAGKTRYVCKRLPLADALAILPARVAAVRGYEGGVTVQAANAITLDSLIERFLGEMLTRVKTHIPKKMAVRTYDDYVDVLARFAEVIGGSRLVASLGADDFSRFAATFEGRALSTQRREIQYIDRLFNWAGPGKKSKNLIPQLIRGPGWQKPSAEEMATAGSDADKAYTIEQLRGAFEKVKDDPFLLAAAHAGFGCGFIPADCDRLPEKIVDLDNAIILFKRGKTGVSRICPLMPAAVDAFRRYLAYKSRFKNMRGSTAGTFFMTIYGRRLSRHYVPMGGADAGGYEDNQLTKRWGAKVGLPYTGLRTTFATLVDDWHDQRAIDMVMGHSAGKMGKHIRVKHYARQFSPDRVRALVCHAYALAFGSGAPSGGASPQTPAPDPASQTPGPATPAKSEGPRG